MEIVLLALTIFLVLLNLIMLSNLKIKNSSAENTIEKMGRLETSLIKEFGDFRNNFSRDLNNDFSKMNERIENRLNMINDRVNERLDVNFEKTNKTFTSILERLTKIDEAQKKIDDLSTNIVSLQDVLTDKKARGTFGEVNLKNIMVSVFGDNNDSLYKMQYTFPNGTMVDCILIAPDPLGVVSIDSKFPLENYRRMIALENNDKKEATKKFKEDLKKHIDDIADKYIINGVTSDQAIMFIPAEAIFAEVHAYHQDVVEYANKRRVFITSPTTLMSTLTTVQIVMKNIERDKYATIIHKELVSLDEEFKRYKLRWDKLSRSMDTVSRDVKDIHTTTDKITKRFDSISQVEIKNEVKGVPYDE